ncbi:MAG: hypothetical protein J7647_01670 [Cyanobacteria bacterium SBLK]|nr:hypothetical protein [Cyanobacteria bacterium SBLK]
MAKGKDNPELQRLRYQAQLKQQIKKLQEDNQALKRDNDLLNEKIIKLQQEQNNLIDRLAKKAVENKQLLETGNSYSYDIVIPFAVLAAIIYFMYSISVSLSKAIAFLLLVIVIIMGFYIYKMKKQQQK